VRAREAGIAALRPMPGSAEAPRHGGDSTAGPGVAGVRSDPLGP